MGKDTKYQQWLEERHAPSPQTKSGAQAVSTPSANKTVDTMFPQTDKYLSWLQQRGASTPKLHTIEPARETVDAAKKSIVSYQDGKVNSWQTVLNIANDLKKISNKTENVPSKTTTNKTSGLDVSFTKSKDKVSRRDAERSRQAEVDKYADEGYNTFTLFGKEYVGSKKDEGFPEDGTFGEKVSYNWNKLKDGVASIPEFIQSAGEFISGQLQTDERKAKQSAENAKAAKQLSTSWNIDTAGIQGSKTRSNVVGLQNDAASMSFGEKMGTTATGALMNYGASTLNAGLTVLDTVTGKAISSGEAGDFAKSLFDVTNLAAEGVSGLTGAQAQAMSEHTGWLGNLVLTIERTTIEQITDRILGAGIGGKVGGMIPFASRVFGSTAQEAEDKGLGLAGQIALGSARTGLEVALEALGGFGGSWRGTGYGDRVFQLLDSWIARKTNSELLGTIAATFGSEMMEEMLADVGNPIIDRLFKISDGDESFLEAVWGDGQILYDGLVGGLAGVMGSGGNYLGYSVQSKQLGVDITTYKAAERIVTNKELRASFEEFTGVELSEDENSAITQAAVLITGVADDNYTARDVEADVASKDASRYIEQVALYDAATAAAEAEMDRTAEPSNAEVTEPPIPDAEQEAAEVSNVPNAEQPETTNVETKAEPTKSKALHESYADMDSDNSSIESYAAKYEGRAADVQNAYSEGQDVEEYGKAFDAAYRMGESMLPERSLGKVQNLTDEQKQIAFQMGRDAAKERATTRALNVFGKGTGGRGVVSGDGISLADVRKKFNDAQNTAYRVLDKFARATGMNIVLYASDETGSREEGSFSWKDNTIRININSGVFSSGDVKDLSKYTALRTFSHELTHFTEKWNAEQYDSLREFVFEALDAKGVDVDERIQLRMAAGLSYDMASREVVADSMADMLGQSDIFERLAKKDANMAQSLLNKLKEFVARLKQAFKSMTTQNNYEAEILKDTIGYSEELVKKWTDALEGSIEAYNPKREAEQPKKPKEKKPKEQQKKSENIKQQSFAGRKAETADNSLRRQASLMEEMGEDSETIREQTGWFKGMDGRWKYEIDDSAMQFSRTGFFSNPDVVRYKELESKMVQGIITEEEFAELQSLSKNLAGVRKTPKYLREYMKHDKLFEAYPELGDIEVKFADIGNARGRYDPDDNTITLNERLKKDDEMIKNVILHELQHSIQRIEYFAGGASVGYWQQRINEGYSEEVKAEAVAKADRAYKQMFNAAPNELKEKIREINREKLADNWDKVIELENELYASEYAKQYMAIDDADFERRAAREKDYAVNAEDLYRNTAGEIEARDTVERRNLTGEQRKNTRPDVDREDVVFSERSGGFDEDIVQSSIKNTRGMAIGKQLSAVISGELKSSDALFFGDVNLTDIGFGEKPLAMTQTDFWKSFSEKHNTPRRVFKTLVENLKNNKILSFEENNRMGLLLDDVDGDGKPLLAALAEGEMDRLPVNLINSLYGVENWWLQTQVDRGRKLKIYDMKKATAVLQTNGYEAEVGEDGDYRLIKSQSTENVKEENITQKSLARDDAYAGYTYAEISEEQQRLSRRENENRERKRAAENNPELNQALDSYSNLFSELKELLAKRRSGTATGAELDRIEEVKRLREKGLQRISEIQADLGLKELEEEAREIRETRETLRIAADAAWEREGAEKENKAIEKSGLSAEEYFRKKALKAFKTTTNFNEAGYLLPDGKMLNFSGGERNHRHRDHREIGEIYEATNGVRALNRFLSDGNIRVMAESPGIDLAAAVEPTEAQYAAIRKFVNSIGKKDGKFFIDFSDVDGHRRGNYFYTDSVNADRIIKDIQHFYRTGEIRGASSVVSQFHDNDQFARGKATLSDRELLEAAAARLPRDKLTESEKLALVDFQKKLDKLKELQEQRAEQGRIYKQQMFTKGRNKEEAQKTKNRMDILDKKINSLENTILSMKDRDVFKKILKSARDMIEREARASEKKTLAEYRAKRNESEGQKKYRDRVIKTVRELMAWISTPSAKEGKRVPLELQEALSGLLSSIDFTSKRALKGGDPTKQDIDFKKKLQAVKAALDKNIEAVGAESGYVDIRPEFSDEYTNLLNKIDSLIGEGEDYVINRMSSEDLKQLSELLKEVKHYIQNANTMHENEVFKTAHEAGDETIKSLGELGKASKHSELAGRFFTWYYNRPAYVFSYFGKGGESVYQEFRKAQGIQARLTKEVLDFSERTFTPEMAKRWAETTRTFNIDGENVKIPITHIMSMYCLSKREQGLLHLLGGGFRVANFKNGKQTVSDVGHKITKEKLDEILATLDQFPAAKKVADELQKYMSTVCAAWGNEVDMVRFGVPKFLEKNYFPVNSDGRQLAATADEAPKEASLYALLNAGFTKSLQIGANNRLIVYDIFDVFASHTNSMVQYRSFALPVLDALKWFNHKNGQGVTVRDAMSKAFGSKSEEKGSGGKSYAEDFVINLLKDYNGARQGSGKFDTALLKGLSNINRTRVSFNLSTMLLQPTSIARAGMFIGGNKLLRGFGMAAKDYDALAAEMEKHSGIALWKSLGFYDVNVSRGVAEQIKQDMDWKQKFNELGMKGAEAADRFTWTAIWAASKASVNRARYKTDAEYFEAVNTVFEEVIYKTQVVDSVLTKAEAQREKGFGAKSVMSFMSESVASTAVLSDAAIQYDLDSRRIGKAEAWKKNRKHIGRAVKVWTVSKVISAAMSALVAAWRDDDEYEEFGEKYFSALKEKLIEQLNPLSDLPLIGDVISMLQGYDDSSELGQIVNYFTSAYGIITDKLDKDDDGDYEKYTWWGAMYKVLQGASAILGVPFATASRELVDLWNNTAGRLKPEWKLHTYDPGVQNSIKYAYLDGYISEEEAQQLLIEEGAIEEEDIEKAKSTAYWLVQNWQGIGKYDEIIEAVSTMNSSIYRTEFDHLISRGVREQDIYGKVTDYIKEGYLAGNISYSNAKASLEAYGGKEADDAEDIVNALDFELETGYEWDADGGFSNGVMRAFEDGAISRQEAIEWYAKASSSTHGSLETAEEYVRVGEWRQSVAGAEDFNVSALEKWDKYGFHTTDAGLAKEDFVWAWKLYDNASAVYSNSGDRLKEKGDVFFEELYNRYMRGEISFWEMEALAHSFYSDSYYKRYKFW